jgi:hypothetical protein
MAGSTVDKFYFMQHFIKHTLLPHTFWDYMKSQSKHTAHLYRFYTADKPAIKSV